MTRALVRLAVSHVAWFAVGAVVLHHVAAPLVASDFGLAGIRWQTPATIAAGSGCLAGLVLGGLERWLGAWHLIPVLVVASAPTLILSLLTVHFVVSPSDQGPTPYADFFPGVFYWGVFNLLSLVVSVTVRLSVRRAGPA